MKVTFGSGLIRGQLAGVLCIPWPIWYLLLDLMTSFASSVLLIMKLMFEADGSTKLIQGI